MTRSQPSFATLSAWTPRRRVATRASTPSASSVAASTTVVVTGGASGVGYRVAREFVERGARVFVATRDGDRAMRAAESLGEDVVGVRCDVSVADDVEALMERVVRDETTTTTHWLNAAGAVTKNAPLCDVDADGRRVLVKSGAQEMNRLSKSKLDLLKFYATLEKQRREDEANAGSK